MESKRQVIAAWRRENGKSESLFVEVKLLALDLGWVWLKSDVNKEGNCIGTRGYNSHHMIIFNCISIITHKLGFCTWGYNSCMVFKFVSTCRKKLKNLFSLLVVLYYFDYLM